MSYILMDNWSITNALSCLDYNYDTISRKYLETLRIIWENFLTAIVLWDEIGYLRDDNASYNWGTIFRDKLLDFEYNFNELFFQIDLKDYINDDEILKHLQLTGGIDERTEKYRLISQAIQVNLLLHPDRSKCINENINNQYNENILR